MFCQTGPLLPSLLTLKVNPFEFLHAFFVLLPGRFQLGVDILFASRDVASRPLLCPDLLKELPDVGLL